MAVNPSAAAVDLCFVEGGGFQGVSGASATAFVAMLGSSLQPPAPAPGPTPSSAAPASPAPSSCLSASPSAASVPSPASSPFHHHPSPHPHHPHPHHHPSPHHFGGSAHRATGGLRVPWPPPASNHPPEGFGRFGGGLYSLFPAPAATVSNSPAAEAVYSPSPSPSSPAASPAGTPFASADHYHSFIAAQKESLFSSTFAFNGGAGNLVGAGLQAHFSTPHVGLLTPATGLERGITQLEMMAKKGFGVDKPPSSEANSSDGNNKANLSRDGKEHHQRQQRRGGTSAQHWPEVRFIMPKSENGNHGQQQHQHPMHHQQAHHPCHEPVPSPADLHNNNRRRGSKRRWPETSDMSEPNSAKMDARSACACHRVAPVTTSSSSTATTILTVPTSLPLSQVYQPRGTTVGTTYHVASKGDATCKRNGTDLSAAAEGKAGGMRAEDARKTASGVMESEEDQRNSAGGCSRTTPVSLRCPRDSSTPTHGARSASSAPHSPLTLHHHQHHQQQGQPPQGPPQTEWGGGGLLQLQVTVKKESGADGLESSGTTPCQVAEVTTSRSSAEGATPTSTSNGAPSAEPNPIAALSQMPLLCMSPNAVLLKSIKVEEGPMPPSPGVVSPTTTSTTPVECAQPQTKDCNGRQTPVKRQQHSKSKKDSMHPYAEVPLSSTSNSVAQVSLGAIVGRQQRVEDAAPRLAPLPHVTPVSITQLEKRPETQQAPAGGLLLVRGADHQKGRVKGISDVSQTPSTPTLTVSAPSAMVAPVPACNPPSTEQLTATSISASAIAAPGAVLQSAPCDEAAAGEVAAAVAAAVANGMHSWAGPAPLHHSPALTPPHHLHHHHTLWLGQGQTFPAPVPLQLGASQAQATDAQHVPLPPVGYQLVRDPLTGQLLLIPATNLAEHLQRAAAAAAAAVVWPSFPSALPPHASASSPHLHQLMLQQPQQPQQQHIQLFPGSQHPPQTQHQTAEHHQTETEYRILFQHQIQQQQHHQSHQLQQQQPPDQTLVIPPVHEFVKKKEDSEGAPLVSGHASAGILIAVPKVEVVEPEEDEQNAPISVDDVKPGIGVATAQPTSFLHPHQPHLTHARRSGAELLVPSVATIGTVVSPAAAQVPSSVPTSASFPPYVFPASIASAVGAGATPVAAATAVTTTPAVQYFYEHAGMVRMAQAAQPSAAVQTESGRRSQGTSPVNPADTCLTPPPETPCVASEGPEEIDMSSSRSANTGDALDDLEIKPSSSAACNVNDVSTVLDTRSTSTETESSASATNMCSVQQEMDEPTVQVQDAGNQTEMTMGSDDDSTAINASSDEATNESTQHASAFTSADVMTSTDSQDATLAPKTPRLVVIQPPLQSPPNNLDKDDSEINKVSKSDPKVCVSSNEAVDLSGLELLSNSIEQFENNRTQEMPRLERNETRSVEISESEVDNKVKELEHKKEDSEPAPRLDIEASLEDIVEKPKLESNTAPTKEVKNEDDSSGALAGGLSLLCALAEQRFMEEVARSEPANQASPRAIDMKGIASPSAASRNSVDIHRNYKSPKSEREIKAFIASKVSQYQGQNSSQVQPFQYSQVQQNLFQSILSSNTSASGTKSFPSSPFSSTINGGSTSAGSSGSCSGSFGGTSEVMDAMELDMRMRLAELQRKYREKQRELSRLQHSRTKATGDEATTASGAESCAVASSDNPSPTKRGPGRPRKQTGKKVTTPSLNSALAATRRGSSSSSGSSCCGGISPQKELSPPVLEKVTEVMALRKRRRRRQRKTLRRHHKQKCGYSEDEDDEDDTGDDDGDGEKEPADAAPRLRLASKEILKPPTLTANRIINCARFKPEETSDGLSSEASIKAFKLPQCNVNLVKLKASTITGRVKASDLTPTLPKPGTSTDTKGKIGVAGSDKHPNGPSLLVSASSASGASWLARNTQNNNSYITTSNTSDHNKNKASNISNNDSSSLSPFHRNSLLSPSTPSPLNGKTLLAPSTLRIPSSVPSVRKQSLSCYTFGSKQLTPSLLSSGEKQRLESLTSDSSLLWFLKPDSDASKEPAVGVGGFSPSQKAEEKRTPSTSVTNETATTETTLGSNSLGNTRKRKIISSAPQTDRPQLQGSPIQSLRSSPSSLSSSSSSSSIYSSSSSPPTFKKRKPGRPKKHSTRSKALVTETIVAKKLKKKSVVGFIVGPPAPVDPPTTESRTPLAAPIPSIISAPASPATASTAPLAPCPSPHKPKIKPKLKAEAKVKSSLSCDDEDDWIQLPPSIPSPLKGRRRVFEDASSATLPTASPAGTAAATSRTTWSAEGCPLSLGWNANSSGTAATPTDGGSTETSPQKTTPMTGLTQQTVPRTKKKLTSKGKQSLARKKLLNQGSSTSIPGTSAVGVASEQVSGGTQESETTPASEKRRRSGERAATTQDLLRSLKKRQTRTQSAGGSVGGVAGGNVGLTGATLAAKVTVRSRSFADNHESSSYSEGENVPLIALKERPSTPVPRSCKITQEDLHDGLRALTSPDGGGLLYAGQINAIQAPDVYGITLDGERGHRPHIYSREEILKDAIAEVRPGSIRHLQPGTRVCAYWSQQYRCLYPGTVAAPSSPDPELDRRFISVEFDDGDSGRININDIRLLPQDFPIVDYDPNPLMSLARRRRRASGASASGGINDSIVSKDKKEQSTAGASGTVSSIPAANDEASTSTAALTCDSSLAVSKAKKQKREAEKDGDSIAEKDIRKKSSYWKEMEKTISASANSASNSGSALVEADSSGLPMPGTKPSGLSKKLTAAEKEKRRMRKREKARKRDKLRRQQLLAAKIAATSLNCDDLSGSPGTASGVTINPDLASILKKKHKKHRSNKCDEKCMLIGKKHRHHHHHRKHHRHHHHKHRHHRRGSRHCIGSIVANVMSDAVSSEPNAESMIAETKASVSSPVVLTHPKRKKKKKKADNKAKEPVTILTDMTSVTESMQTSTSDSNEAPPPPPPPPQPATTAVELEEAPADTEPEKENSLSNEDSSATTSPEITEAAPKKTGQKNTKKDNSGGATTAKAATTTPARKQRDRQPSVESRSKMAAFLPARQLWRWSGRGFKRPGAKGRGKKEFYKSIQRGKETIKVGDCAVFLSTGRPDRPYIGSIESMWESWGGNMVVRVKWFYHPEETKGGPSLETLKFPGALFQSPHVDENDVQTISHKCEVLAFGDYRKRMGDGGTGDEMEPSRYASVYDNNDVYYLAGHYDPTNAVLTMEADISKG